MDYIPDSQTEMWKQAKRAAVLMIPAFVATFAGWPTVCMIAADIVLVADFCINDPAILEQLRAKFPFASRIYDGALKAYNTLYGYTQRD
jgi:hypothetical protein